MTVAELMEKLKTMPPDARVMVDDPKAGLLPLVEVGMDEDVVVLW